MAVAPRGVTSQLDSAFKVTTANTSPNPATSHAGESPALRSANPTP
jgi:hypothetical protein